ncbi:MAG: hypothetical protein Kow0025_09380 [Thermodesulfovibrionales bacterium]
MTPGATKSAFRPALVIEAAALLLSLVLFFPLSGSGEEHLGYPRVRDAVREKGPSLRSLFERRGLGYPPRDIFIRAFKAERVLELWARDEGYEGYAFVKSYPFCAASGGPGPKRRAGDGQIPEGFYHIERFNPASEYHLSLGIDYPNEHDRAMGWGGGDIFIHGGCRTVGCIPLTDESIKELYVAAALAREGGQRRIPVHIFPARLDGAGFRGLAAGVRGDRALLAFWENLRRGYEIFESTRHVPEVEVDGEGRYAYVSDTVSADLIRYVLSSSARGPALRFRLGGMREADREGTF